MVDSDGLLSDIKKAKTILVTVFTLFISLIFSIIIIIWCIVCACQFHMFFTSTYGIHLLFIVMLITMVLTYRVYSYLKVQVMLENMVNEFNDKDIGDKISTAIKLIASIYIHYPKYSKHIKEKDNDEY